MDSIERYRRYASECLTLAQAAPNNGEKVLLLQMAETWRHLAELADRCGKGDEDGRFKL
jgi:hypothetical protein